MVHHQGDNTNPRALRAANAALVVTLAGAAKTNVHLYRVDAFCSGGASNLTITDGATVILTQPISTVTAALTVSTWPVALTFTAGNNGIITLAACGVGQTGTLNITADRF